MHTDIKLQSISPSSLSADTNWSLFLGLPLWKEWRLWSMCPLNLQMQRRTMASNTAYPFTVSHNSKGQFSHRLSRCSSRGIGTPKAVE